MPAKGYIEPQVPAHQNMASIGCPVVAAAPSATQDEIATGLANSATSGLVKKANSSLFQVGSSSDTYIRSKSL